MFILTKPIKGSGDEPFVPLPPYNPKTGENLPGVPFHHTLVRPTIRKSKIDILALRKGMDIGQIKTFISGLDNEDIAELIKELLDRAKK